MNSISFGQYYPADSFLHRMDPRAKVILALLYIVCAFLASGTVSFILLLVSSVAVVLMSRIPLRTVFRSISAIIIIMAIASLFNLFMYVGSPENLLWHWYFYADGTKGLAIYTEGIYRAVYTLVRIVALVVGSSIFMTYTTTPIALTDALESLLHPLTYLKVPVHTFAMMMSIALRFIPIIVDETQKIMDAQKARGADFTSGGLVKRAKALIPVIIPLFVSAFRRADELATAMTCRCYRGGNGRTKLRVLKYRVSDFLAMAAMAAFGTALVLSNIYIDFGYRMWM